LLVGWSVGRLPK